ncbi:MAG: hypothetical protein F6K08_16495 [Okeania sp. SIO1H6]|uniref:hypothetical protein n=1 Tax=Okeania sp. SIO1H5 TaxID=2607777 RepID=UPI0013B893FB|nr:hypothetical protein [Okeania sp. SIO1H5]NES76314.1 hypothetical protein [Okeania sp. SIO1H4]NET14312.1 hypothetical protein [Okeania sp. SIO1H6]NET19759.1 hypothetical protein [Okeania sp. SIO1H5]
MPVDWITPTLPDRNRNRTVEEGDRRQETGDRRKITWGFAPPSNFEHRVDGGVLNPQRK